MLFVPLPHDLGQAGEGRPRVHRHRSLDLRLGRELQAFRARYGLTQDEVARVVGASSAAAISQWEAGHKVPDGLRRERLRELLDGRLWPELRAAMVGDQSFPGPWREAVRWYRMAWYRSMANCGQPAWHPDAWRRRARSRPGPPRTDPGGGAGNVDRRRHTQRSLAMIPVVVNLIVVLLVLGVLAGLASQSVRIVREYERLVVFRLRAEGDKQAKILQAEGYAQSLRTVFGAAQQIDSKTMTLQVIDGLKALGASPSSTFVIPMELTRLLGQVGSYLDRSLASGDSSSTGALSNGTEAAAEPLGSRA